MLKVPNQGFLKVSSSPSWTKLSSFWCKNSDQPWTMEIFPEHEIFMGYQMIKHVEQYQYIMIFGCVWKWRSRENGWVLSVRSRCSLFSDTPKWLNLHYIPSKLVIHQAITWNPHCTLGTQHDNGTSTIASKPSTWFSGMYTNIKYIIATYILYIYIYIHNIHIHCIHTKSTWFDCDQKKHIGFHSLPCYTVRARSTRPCQYYNHY